MRDIGQITSRVAAALQRRETLRVAVPAAVAVVVAGVLLGVFLPGGSDPEAGGSSGTTVAIAERTADASGNGAPPADGAPADTADAADAGDTAVTAEPGPDAAPAAATTGTAETAGSSETAGGTESAGTTGTAEGTEEAGTTEAADTAGTTETADTAGTTVTAGTASASSSADAAAGGADAAAQQDAAAPTAEGDGAPAATAEAGLDEESPSSAGADEAAIASGGDAADTAVSGDAAGDAPAEGVEFASGQELAAASAGDDAEPAAAASPADGSVADGSAAAEPSVDDAGAVEGADGSEAPADAAEAPGNGESAETAPSSQATSAGAGEAAQAGDETIVEASVVPDEGVDAALERATGEGSGEGRSTATEPSDAGGDGGQTASGEEPGDAVTPPSFDTVRIRPDGRAMIAGRAEPGAEVTIQSGSTVIGSVIADPRGEWMLQTDEPIPPGDHELSVVETLPDGRQVESEHVLVFSAPDLAAGEKAGDVQAVLVPRDGEEPGDAVTPPSFDTVRIRPDGRAVIAGRAEPGAEVTIQSGLTVIGSVTADPRGEWMLQSDEPIPPGDHELSAVETLPDGRQVESEHVLVFSAPDLAAGEKAGDVQAVLVPRDGEEPGDAVTPPSFDTVRIRPDGRAVIAGRAEPGAEVTIQSGSTVIGSVTADQRGEWVLVPDEPIESGDHQLTLVETLPDGSQVESEHVVIVSIPDPASGEDGSGTALVVLAPRDGEGKSRVLQQPPPAEEKAVDVARLDEASPDEVPPDDSGAETDPATAGDTSPGALSDAGDTSPGASSDAGDTSPGASSDAGDTSPGASSDGTEMVSGASSDGTEMASGASSDAGDTSPGASPDGTDTSPGASSDAGDTSPGASSDAGDTSPDTSSDGAEMASGTSSGAGDTSPDTSSPGAEMASGASSDRGEASPDTSPDAGEMASATPSGEGVEGPLAVNTVDYDEEGDMIIAGKADPGADLQVYLDDQHVGTAESGEEGEWEIEPGDEVEPGRHTLRVDQVDPAGLVLLRIETPLMRARPEELSFGEAIVVVQPGNSLWRIARRTLGGGVHFTEIYEANRSQIADPALIYPGQVFTVPELD